MRLYVSAQIYVYTHTNSYSVYTLISIGYSSGIIPEKIQVFKMEWFYCFGEMSFMVRD